MRFDKKLDIRIARADTHRDVTARGAVGVYGVRCVVEHGGSAGGLVRRLDAGPRGQRRVGRAGMGPVHQAPHSLRPCVDDCYNW